MRCFDPDGTLLGKLRFPEPEAGFAGQAHLTRHFKRVVGVPPGAYRRERGRVGCRG